MSTPIDTGDVAEVPVDERENHDGYNQDDYGGTPVLLTKPRSRT